VTARAAAFVEAAHAYSGLGWALVRGDGKNPKVHGTGWERTKPLGPDNAAGKWAEWGRRWNLGVVCGTSTVAVLDVDYDDDPDAACLGLLGLVDLPETPIVRTGKGRLQVYYRDPGGLEKHARNGFELRVGDHMCVAPPSVHPDTGRAYEWLPEHAPWEVELAELPARLIDYFAASTNGRKPAAALGDEIPTGERNERLASLAGTMRRRRASEQAILAALKVTNKEQCNPPLPDDEVERIAGSIAKKEPAAAPATVRTSDGASSSDGERMLYARPLEEVEMRSITWLEKPLWQGSAFQLLAGPKGSGKGTYLAGLAARRTRAGDNVLFVSTEDSTAIDLKPRLVAAGAVIARCFDIPLHVRLPDDVYALQRLALELGGVGMFVIDPVANHIGDRDSNNDVAVRDAIAPLNWLADQLECLLIGVRHPGKDRSRGAVASILGSTAWVDTPRAAVFIAKDDEDDLLRHIQVVVGNRSLNGSAQAFRIEAVDVPGLTEPITRAVELGASSKSVDDLLAARTAEPSRTDRARDLILDILEGEGAQESDALDARVANETGLSARTIRNLRGELKNEGLIRAAPVKGDTGAVASWQVVRTAAPRDAA
jgi:predicted transcriptional regulator